MLHVTLWTEIDGPIKFWAQMAFLLSIYYYRTTPLCNSQNQEVSEGQYNTKGMLASVVPSSLTRKGVRL